MMQVVVAVIQRDDGHFFVCKRQAHQAFAGYWEFPGGKQEQGENEDDAMRRELQEEIGIQVIKMCPVMSIPTQQADKHICLHIWHITQWSGIPHGAEGQGCAWVNLDELARLQLPPANQVLIDALLSGDLGKNK